MNDLEKLKRHLGKPIPLSFKNDDGEEDIFYFKSLNIQQQATLMEINRRIQRRPKEIVEGLEVPEISKEDILELTDLLVDIVKNSFDSFDDDMAKSFVEYNFTSLFENLNELMPKNQNSRAIEMIKKKQGEAKKSGI